MSSISNTIGFLQSRVASGGSPVTASAGLDPNDQRVLQTVRLSSSLPLASAATATGLTPKAVVDSINRLQARNLLELVSFEDQAGRHARLTPQGYSLLAGDLTG